MSDVSIFDENIKGRIRTLWLKDLPIVDICKELNLNTGTWDNYYYLNKNGFRDFVNSIKKEKFLQNAETISKEVFEIKAENNAKLLSIKQKEAEFLRETLGKDLGYSKRIETIGLNINKNEPLDPDQRARLDNLLKNVSGQVNVSVEYVDKQGENGNVNKDV
jgi:hypothetical protein